jgi:hypothetical protein
VGYRLLADAVAVLHFLFVAFIPLGGLLALRWPRVALVHLVCAVWGALIVFTDVVCPLTPLEKTLRAWGGGAGYDGGFIRHYLVGSVFPGGLSPWAERGFLLAAVLLNVLAYRLVVRRWRRSSRAPGVADPTRTA